MTKFQLEMKKFSETDLVKNFHKQENINFTALPSFDIVSLKDKLKIHESYNYFKRQKGSEYWIGKINGKLAYIRRSDHWGYFSTTEYDDIRQEPVYVPHEWHLIGAEKRKDGGYKNIKQFGYVYLE